MAAEREVYIETADRALDAILRDVARAAGFRWHLRGNALVVVVSEHRAATLRIEVTEGEREGAPATLRAVPAPEENLNAINAGLARYRELQREEAVRVSASGDRLAVAEKAAREEREARLAAEQEVAHLRWQRDDLQGRNTELVEQRRAAEERARQADAEADVLCDDAFTERDRALAASAAPSPSPVAPREEALRAAAAEVREMLDASQASIDKAARESGTTFIGRAYDPCPCAWLNGGTPDPRLEYHSPTECLEPALARKRRAALASPRPDPKENDR